jgi:redox-sensitive bicupin YhaK (pirin superfamily)
MYLHIFITFVPNSKVGHHKNKVIMSRTIVKTTTGYVAPLGEDLVVRRLVANQEIRHVNPFIFLDHFGPSEYAPQRMKKSTGTGAHPHRGFITFTYILNGEFEHRDSIGNHSIVSDGGGQWMVAGSGIVHDEKPSDHFMETGGILEGFQLWINLPAQYKGLTPQYLPLHATDVPEVKLDKDSGTLRVLIGNYLDVASKVPTYHPHHVYDVVLLPGKQANIKVDPNHEGFAFISRGSAKVAGTTLTGSVVGLLSKQGDTISIENTTSDIQHVMLFMAEPLHEPMASYGPFVMNTNAEIQMAVNDYHAGKYGEIQYV